MLLRLFILFTLIPFIEIFLLIQLSSYMGAISTFVLVIATGFAGANLAKLQGAQTIMRIKDNYSRGIMPGDDLIDAFLILIAGIVLITPGILTDIAGILLLFPTTRASFKQFVKKEFAKRVKSGQINIRKY